MIAKVYGIFTIKLKGLREISVMVMKNCIQKVDPAGRSGRMAVARDPAGCSDRMTAVRDPAGCSGKWPPPGTRRIAYGTRSISGREV